MQKDAEIVEGKGVFTKYSIVALVITAVALAVRLVRATTFAVQNDAGHYAARALGWFDYLESSRQTTPIQWFGTIPWWAHLSFHDAPALVFLIQKVFFSLLGDTVFALRLPGILAGTACVYVAYLIVRRVYGEWQGLVAAAIFALSSFAVWNSLSGNLEAVQIVFIMLTALFFLHVVEDVKKIRWLYLTAISLALALLSKYTAMFLLPAMFTFLFVWHRSEIRENYKKFILPSVCFFILLAPVFVYNVMVFVTRGHFDSALSAMFGMHPEDFSLIAGRSTNVDFVNNLTEIGRIFLNTNSVGFLLLALFAVVFLSFLLRKKILNSYEKFSLLSLGFGLLMFLFSGPADRWLPILLPFIIFAVVALIHRAVLHLKAKNIRLMWLSVGLFAIILLGEFGYMLNTNILTKPALSAPWFYSPQRFRVDGTDQFGRYLDTELFATLLERKTPRTTKEISSYSVQEMKGKNVLFFDDRINWFSYMWYVYRYRTYYHTPVIAVSELLHNNPKKMIADFKKAGVAAMYVMYITPDGPMDQIAKNLLAETTNFEKVVKTLEKTTPVVKTIVDPYGKEVFKFYKIQ